METLVLPIIVYLTITGLLWLSDKLTYPLGVFALGMIAVDYWRSPWDLHDAGFQLANTPHAVLVYTGIMAITAAVAVFAVGPTISGKQPSGSLRGTFDDYLGTMTGALPQQIILCGYFLPRLTEALGPVWGVLCAAVVFSTLHLPNPFLSATTFVAGGLVGWAWLLVPNIGIAALAHVAGTVAIQSFVDERTTGWFKVGRRFLVEIEERGGKWPWEGRNR